MVLDDEPGYAAEQTVLATVIDERRVAFSGRRLWVVNLDVSGHRIPLHGPPGSPPDTGFLYRIVFVDPETGQGLYGLSVGESID